MEQGESAEDCIRREMREELKWNVMSARQIFSLTHAYPGKTVQLHFMLCRMTGKPDAMEQQHFGWFCVDDAFALDLTPADREALDAMRTVPELAAFYASRLPLLRLPEWMKISLDGAKIRKEVGALLHGASLHTVCEGAQCPNRCECWRRRTATFMILGDTCTRNCRFCAVKHGLPLPVDMGEPQRIGESVKRLGLKYAVITCVTRDDLPDGGAGIMAETILAIRACSPETKVEVLCSDYNGEEWCVQRVLEGRPDVYGHNLETVERLTPAVRNRADYHRSLKMLQTASSAGFLVKSGLMLGLGENAEEIRQALADLRKAGVSILTMGQYLRPSMRHWPVHSMISPQEFQEWGRIAEEEFGFTRAVCGPLVRSSYLAEEAYQLACHCPEH